LFEPGNVDDLAEKLTRVLTMSADEVLKFRKESLAIVAAHDIQRTLDTFESLYRGEEVTNPAALGKKNESAS
jgi:trehalose-6-phosphate synthase